MSTRRWTTRELIEIGITAADNALDDAGDGPMKQTFESELAFQLNAPEHRGMPRLTSKQVALLQAIWDETLQGAAV